MVGAGAAETDGVGCERNTDSPAQEMDLECEFAGHPAVLGDSSVGREDALEVLADAAKRMRRKCWIIWASKRRTRCCCIRDLLGAADGYRGGARDGEIRI